MPGSTAAWSVAEFEVDILVESLSVVQRGAEKVRGVGHRGANLYIFAAADKITALTL